MSRPESTRSNALSPSCQCTAVATAREDPRGSRRVAATTGVKRQLNGASEVGSIVNSVVQSEIGQVLSGQNAEGARFTPVAMLQDYHGATNRLSKEPSDRPVGQVTSVFLGGDLTWGEEDDRGTGALPVLAAPPVGLVEGSEGGVIMVEELLEDALTVGGGVGRALRDGAGGVELCIAKRRRDEALTQRFNRPSTAREERGGEEHGRLHLDGAGMHRD